MDIIIGCVFYFDVYDCYMNGFSIGFDTMHYTYQVLYLSQTNYFSIAVIFFLEFLLLKQGLGSLMQNKWDWVFQKLFQYYLWLCLLVYIRLMIRLWEFQNGKMGLYSPKIDWDTAKNVNDEILKNDSFR